MSSVGFFAVDVLSHAVWPLLYHSSKHVGLVELDDFLPVLAAARSAMEGFASTWRGKGFGFYILLSIASNILFFLIHR